MVSNIDAVLNTFFPKEGVLYTPDFVELGKRVSLIEPQVMVIGQPQNLSLSEKAREISSLFPLSNDFYQNKGLEFINNWSWSIGHRCRSPLGFYFVKIEKKGVDGNFPQIGIWRYDSKKGLDENLPKLFDGTDEIKDRLMSEEESLNKEYETSWKEHPFFRTGELLARNPLSIEDEAKLKTSLQKRLSLEGKKQRSSERDFLFEIDRRCSRELCFLERIENLPEIDPGLYQNEYEQNFAEQLKKEKTGTNKTIFEICQKRKEQIKELKNELKNKSENLTRRILAEREPAPFHLSSSKKSLVTQEMAPFSSSYILSAADGSFFKNGKLIVLDFVKASPEQRNALKKQKYAMDGVKQILARAGKGEILRFDVSPEGKMQRSENGKIYLYSLESSFLKDEWIDKMDIGLPVERPRVVHMDKDNPKNNRMVRVVKDPKENHADGKLDKARRKRTAAIDYEQNLLMLRELIARVLSGKTRELTTNDFTFLQALLLATKRGDLSANYKDDPAFKQLVDLFNEMKEPLFSILQRKGGIEALKKGVLYKQDPDTQEISEKLYRWKKENEIKGPVLDLKMRMIKWQERLREFEKESQKYPEALNQFGFFIKKAKEIDPHLTSIISYSEWNDLEKEGGVDAKTIASLYQKIQKDFIALGPLCVELGAPSMSKELQEKLTHSALKTPFSNAFNSVTSKNSSLLTGITEFLINTPLSLISLLSMEFFMELDAENRIEEKKREEFKNKLLEEHPEGARNYYIPMSNKS